MPPVFWGFFPQDIPRQYSVVCVSVIANMQFCFGYLYSLSLLILVPEIDRIL